MSNCPEVLNEFYTKSETFGASFKKRAERYLSIISFLRIKNPDFLNRVNPTIIQGGFFKSSVCVFREFCAEIAPNSRIFHLDVRKDAFPDVSGESNFIKADLRELPFRGESVDILFMDLVLDYISNQGLREIAAEARRVLTGEGIVLGSLLPLKHFLTPPAFPFYPRDYNDLCRIMSGFIPVFLEKNNPHHSDIFAFAKSGSKFPKSEVKRRSNKRIFSHYDLYVSTVND